MLKEPNSEFEAEAQQQGETLARTICQALNCNDRGHVAIGFAKGLLREHRTLQQSSIATLAQGLLAYAKESKENDFIDMRNEHSVNTLIAIEEQLRNLARAPFI